MSIFIKKKKICIVTANRAEYSRGRTVIRAIAEHPDLEVDLVVMGSHLLERNGYTVREIESDGVPINHRIFMEVDGKNPCSMTKSVALAINDLATYFDNSKPDVVVALTDRYETLAVAVAAALMNIAVAHIQGGEVTGTIDESIRHAITKFAHVHFPASNDAYERIIKMGENREMVFNVGCPATDLLLLAPKLLREEILEKFNQEVCRGGKKMDVKTDFLLMIQHPVTTEYGLGYEQINTTLETVKEIGLQTIILWPNIDAGSDDVSRGIRYFERDNSEKYFVVKHIPHHIFANLLRNTICMIGNSSAGIRESCYFGTPTVNIGTRQQNREHGANVINVSHDKAEIKNAIMAQITHGKYNPEYIYGDGTAGKKIADILSKINITDVQKRITY